MLTELLQLLDEYHAWCDSECERQATKKNLLPAVSPSFDGFYQWLKDKEKGV